MQQQNWWEQDQVVGSGHQPAAPLTITTQRDPLAVRREDRADQANQRAADAAARAAANQAISNQLELTRIRLQQEKDRRDARGAAPQGYRFTAAGNLERIPGGPKDNAPTDASREQQRDAMLSVLNQINRAERLVQGGYATGLTGRIGSHIPGSNRRDLEGALRTVASGITIDALNRMKAASPTGASGMGALSDSEGALLRDALASIDPEQSDQALLDSLQRIRGQYTTQLGRIGYRVDTPSPVERKRGASDQATVVPAATPAGPQGGGGSGPNAPDPYGPNGAYGAPSASLGSVAIGATREQASPEGSAIIDAGIRAGRSEQQVNQALSALGLPTVNGTQYQAAQAYHKQHPAYQGGFGAATRAVPVSGAQRFGASAPAAFAGNLFNGALAGLPSLALGRQQLEMASTANPTASALGTIGGGAIGAAGTELGATAALARMGVNGARLASWAPRLGDALYGTAAGASGNPENPLAGAVTGAVAGVGGGMLGRGVTRALGSGIRGVTDADRQYLYQAGIPMTVGQAVGGVGKQLEDAATSIPGVGVVVNNRRRDGLEQFNRVAFDQALAPIGGTTNGVIREAGVDAARGVRSAAYSNALDPVNVTPDAQFAADVAAAQAQGSRLPADMATRAGYAIDRAGENMSPAGDLTGRGFQQAIRRFRRTTSQNAPLPNGDDLGDVMQNAEGAYTGLIARQSPGTMPALDAANRANRLLEVVRSAVNASRNGTRSGANGVFAPSQLADAAAANAKKFGNTAGTTQQPFFQLSRAGQSVLPSSLPDSGTPLRSALTGGLALAGLGGGTGYASGDVSTGAEAAAGTAALGGLLALGGTRAAQRALVASLMQRNNAAIQLGNLVSRYARAGGIMGTGAAGMALQ